MRLALILLLFSLLVISQINTILEIDLWWNLKTGEYIFKNLKVPTKDLFSYTMADARWIDHEWLSQVIFYIIFSKFGWWGLNILKALIISISFLIIFYLVSCGFKKIIFSLPLLLLSILAFGYRSFLRPEIFSYLFLCAYFYILEKEVHVKLLPFLQVIWVNLHGYFILGPVLVLLYAIGDYFTGERQKAIGLAKVFFYLAMASFVNPYFYKGVLYPLGILADVFKGQRLLMENIHELMMPIRSSYGKFLFYWILAIAASASFLINLKNVKFRHALALCFSFIASYMAVRNIPIFIFLGMPIASINLNRLEFAKNIYDRKYYGVFILIICGLIYLFISSKYYVFTNQYGLRKTESSFSRYLMPSGACNFLEKNNINGRIFNTLDFGPYIGYRFYPERRIFIDTRTDLYKDEFYKLYRNAQNYPEDWKAVHGKYGFQIVLLRHVFSGTEKILRDLHESQEWKLVYYDINSCVFLKNVSARKDFIGRFGIDFRHKELVESDFNIHIARFFQKIGEHAAAEFVYLKLLEKDSGFLEAGNNLSAIYIDAGRYEEGIKLLQRLIKIYPGSPELYANLGTAYLYTGRKEEGLRLLQECARLNPYQRKASFMLGIVYFEYGDLDRAIRQFIKYNRLDPYNAQAHRILGDIYKQKGLFKEAQTEYNEAASLDGL